MKEDGKVKGEKAPVCRVFVVGGWKTLLLPVSLLLFTCAADACTGAYAGKKVTADGSVLIGRTVDFSPYNATMYQQICERGKQVSFGGNTNKYVCAPKATSLYAGRYAGVSHAEGARRVGYDGCAANEKGVILTGTITGATKEKALEKDPFKPSDGITSGRDLR